MSGFSSTNGGRAQPSYIEGQLKTYILKSIQYKKKQHKYITDQKPKRSRRSIHFCLKTSHLSRMLKKSGLNFGFFLFWFVAKFVSAISYA